MQFTELSEEQLSEMQFVNGMKRNSKNPYGDLLQAVSGGKKVLIKLEAGKQLKNLKWCLSQAAKRSGTKLDIKVLADKSGVVVSLASAQPAEAADSGTNAPVASARPRK